MKSEFTMLLAGLRANLAAGTRLALFLPVSPLRFRVSPGHYAMLVLASLAFWAAAGIVRGGMPAAVDLQALVYALAQVPLVLLACLLLARLFGRSALLLGFAVVLTAVDPVLEVVGTLLRLALDTDALEAWAVSVNWAYIAWGYAVMLRGQLLLTGWRTPRAIVGAVLLALLLASLVFLLPRSELWAEESDEQDDAPASMVREDLLHLQAGMLDFRLSELQPERPGVEDIYFLGVAPYASQDTFVSELSSVKRLMDERFDTGGRSLVLVNHPATLQQQPIATATNLRGAIERLGAGINTEEDVLFLFLTTHGTEDHQLVFELPPLKLQQVNPTSLARLLNDSGIKWKIIVISACFSGGFIEPLKDDHTLIITAADDTHQSFGCAYDSDYTWFSRAYFDQALRGTYSLTEAYARARVLIEQRERAGGMAPSNPQMYVGAAMKEKLESLARRLERLGGGQVGVQAALGAAIRD